MLFGDLELRFSFGEFVVGVEQAGSVLDRRCVDFCIGEGFGVEASLDGYRYHLPSECEVEFVFGDHGLGRLSPFVAGVGSCALRGGSSFSLPSGREQKFCCFFSLASTSTVTVIDYGFVVLLPPF